MAASPPPTDMPPPPMLTEDAAKVTLEQRTQLQNWLNSKTPLIGKCPICGSRKWGILDHFVHAPLFYPDGSFIIGGGPAYPFVGLFCDECGNTQFINAVKSGLVGNGKSK